jgi:glutamine cyclotransferase
MIEVTDSDGRPVSNINELEILQKEVDQDVSEKEFNL